jgi:hypothetical protein
MDFTIDITIIALIVLCVAVIILSVFLYKIQIKLNKFLIGSSSNLDESLASLNSSIKEFTIFRAELEKYLSTVEKRLKKSIQSVQTVRFNPFKGTGSGGNQSFATAFLNEESDGVVLSSLYSREHVSVYSKPIKNGISEYELSGEEKEAITEARKTIK